MATLPTRLLEIEFDAGVWTDVTADFVELTTRRGRNRELGAFETGTLTFTLRNDGRKYDPENTAGTYYGKLRPNRRVRYRATYSAVTYPVFLGYIDKISQVYGGPNDATAVFQVSDAFKLLNRDELPRSVYTVEAGADLPEIWYRLDEPTGSATLMNSGSLGRAYDGVVTVFSGTDGLGQAGLVVRDDGTGLLGDATHGTAGAIPLDYSVGTATASFAIEAWVNVTTPLSTLELFFQPGLGTSGQSVGVRLESTGKVSFIIYNTAGTPYGVETSAALASGTRHVVARHDSDRTMHIYVDGVDLAVADFGVPGTTTGTIAKTPGPAYLPRWGSAAVVGTIDEVAIYKSAGANALSAARIAAHNNAGRIPWRGDLPGARLGRIFDLAAIPAGDRNIDAGTTTLQNTSLGGSALAYAQKVEETELGWLFVARDGKVRFIGRQAGVTGGYLTSLATLVDDDSGAGLPYRSVGSDVDEAIIVTRATTSRDGSVAVTVYDAAAKAEFGWLDETHDGLLHDDDGYSLYYSQWILNTHKAPGSRIGAVELELTSNPAALYPAILALELADRVTYKRKPQNIGAVISVDMRVEAITHETGGGYWRTRLQLSPFNIAAGLPVFVWDVTKWDQHVWGI